MRDLSSDMLDLNGRPTRQYRYVLELWDIVTTGAPTIRQIISGDAYSAYAAAYMLDVTEFIMDSIRLTEPGDGRASQIAFSLVNSTSRFHPDFGSDLRYMQNNQVVRLKEGYESVDEDEWVYTFTGNIRGQVGFIEDRSDLRYQTQISAYGRRATPAYVKRTFISRNYGRGVDYGEILIDIATDQMNLDDEEIERLPATLGKVTQFAANSIVDLAPLEAMDKILETKTKSVDFDGEGKIFYYSRDMTRAVNKFYTDMNLIGLYSIPQVEADVFNAIKITGLDKNVTMMLQPETELARATIPVGFWAPEHQVDVVWSNDRSLRAVDTYMRVDTSVNNSLIVEVGDENYDASDEYSGTIRVSIENYVFTLITLIVVTLAAKALIGDIVIVPPLGGITTTITLGRVLESIVMTEIYLALATQGAGQYTILGKPLLPVYLELVTEIYTNGIPDYLVNLKEIQNDWLNEQNEMLDVAQLEMIFETAQKYPREFSVYNDLQIEIGDIIQLPYGNGIKIWIESMSKTISRQQVPMIRVQGYRCP